MIIIFYLFYSDLFVIYLFNGSGVICFQIHYLTHQLETMRCVEVAGMCSLSHSSLMSVSDASVSTLSLHMILPSFPNYCNMGNVRQHGGTTPEMGFSSEVFSKGCHLITWAWRLCWCSRWLHLKICQKSSCWINNNMAGSATFRWASSQNTWKQETLGVLPKMLTYNYHHS